MVLQTDVGVFLLEKLSLEVRNGGEIPAAYVITFRSKAALISYIFVRDPLLRGKLSAEKMD